MMTLQGRAERSDVVAFGSRAGHPKWPNDDDKSFSGAQRSPGVPAGLHPHLELKSTRAGLFHPSYMLKVTICSIKGLVIY